MSNQKKVLIVEDEKSLMEALNKKFTAEGFKVVEAVNGKEGLDKSLSERPDVILLDIIMPVMDGMTMLKKLREDSWGKLANVVLLTNLSDPQRMEEALEKGAFDYLVKSDWRLEDVVKKVEGKIGK